LIPGDAEGIEVENGPAKCLGYLETAFRVRVNVIYAIQNINRIRILGVLVGELVSIHPIPPHNPDPVNGLTGLGVHHLSTEGDRAPIVSMATEDE